MKTSNIFYPIFICQSKIKGGILHWQLLYRGTIWNCEETASPPPRTANKSPKKIRLVLVLVSKSVTFAPHPPPPPPPPKPQKKAHKNVPFPPPPPPFITLRPVTYRQC